MKGKEITVMKLGRKIKQPIKLYYRGTKHFKNWLSISRKRGELK